MSGVGREAAEEEGGSYGALGKQRPPVFFLECDFAAGFDRSGPRAHAVGSTSP